MIDIHWLDWGTAGEISSVTDVFHWFDDDTGLWFEIVVDMKGFAMGASAALAAEQKTDLREPEVSSEAER